jgi:hypothetical protein
MTQTENIQALTNMSKDLSEGEAYLFEKYDRFYSSTVFFKTMSLATKPLNALAGALENLTGGSKLQRKIDRPIFILGNFRSGTTLLETLLLRSADTASFNYFSQILPDSPGLSLLLRRMAPSLDPPMNIPHQPNSKVSGLDPFEGEPFWRACKNNYWTKAESNILGQGFVDEAFGKYFKKTINKYLLAHKKTRFVNKNPWNTLRVGYLSTLFPDAKYVYIVRKPTKILQSHLDMERIFETLFRKHPGLNETLSEQFFPPRIFFRTPRHAEVVKTYAEDKMLANAMAIDDFDACFQAECSALPATARPYVLRYEDLVADLSPQIQKLMEFLELPRFSDSALEEMEGLIDKSLVAGKRSSARYPERVEACLRRMNEEYGYEELQRKSSVTAREMGLTE